MQKVGKFFKMTLNFWDSETPNSLLTSPLTTREERLNNRCRLGRYYISTTWL